MLPCANGPMVLMRILNVGCSADHQRTIIVLEDVEHRRRLTFSANLHEAHRLAREMGRTGCPCNPVYDFLQSLLCACEATVSRVLLDDVGPNGVRAVVYLERAGEELALPCYPPDALALALREKIPIYATPRSLAHAEPPPSASGTLPPRSTEVRQWLEQVKPEDF